jgi:hypothetical protein
MPRNYKVLGQANPGANVLFDLYTVPDTAQAVCSSVLVSDRGGTAAKFRIAIAVAGAADDPKQYIAYDADIGANDVVDFTVGATMGSADKIRVYGSVETLAFNAFGEEIS